MRRALWLSRLRGDVGSFAGGALLLLTKRFGPAWSALHHLQVGRDGAFESCKLALAEVHNMASQLDLFVP